MLKKEDFADFTIFELLQNMWDYTDSLKNDEKANYWFWLPSYKIWREEYLKKSGDLVCQN